MYVKNNNVWKTVSQVFLKVGADWKPIFTQSGPTIVTNGLVLHLDAGNPASYPGSGTTWTDLSGNGNDGTLVNGVGYDSANGGSLVFDGVNDYAYTSDLINIQGPGTLIFIVRYNSLPLNQILHTIGISNSSNAGISIGTRLSNSVIWRSSSRSVIQGIVSLRDQIV